MQHKQSQVLQSQLLMGVVTFVGGLLLAWPYVASPYLASPYIAWRCIATRMDRVFGPSPLLATEPPPPLSGWGWGCCYGCLVRFSCFGAARFWAWWSCRWPCLPASAWSMAARLLSPVQRAVACANVCY